MKNKLLILLILIVSTRLYSQESHKQFLFCLELMIDSNVVSCNSKKNIILISNPSLKPFDSYNRKKISPCFSLQFRHNIFSDSITDFFRIENCYVKKNVYYLNLKRILIGGEIKNNQISRLNFYYNVKSKKYYFYEERKGDGYLKKWKRKRKLKKVLK